MGTIIDLAFSGDVATLKKYMSEKVCWSFPRILLKFVKSLELIQTMAPALASPCLYLLISRKSQNSHRYEKNFHQNFQTYSYTNKIYRLKIKTWLILLNLFFTYNKGDYIAQHHSTHVQTPSEPNRITWQLI